jgi:hypothetical protein
MKSLSDLLHRISWPLLIVGGMVVMVALAAFVTPVHLIDYRNEGATAEEKRAIKREIDSTFAEGALDVSRQAILALRGATSDPARRAELDRALGELDNARKELREAGAEVLRAKREAVDAAREAVQEATTAIEEARQSASEALKLAGVDHAKVNESFDRALQAAKEAEGEAKAALAKEEGRRKLSIDLSLDKDKPLIDVEVGRPEPGEKAGVRLAPPKGIEGAVIDFGKGLGDGWREGARPAAPKSPTPPAAPGSPSGSLAPSPPSPPALPDSLAPSPPSPPATPAVVLPPELRAQIRRDVNMDLKKIGIGAGLILIFIPLFILTVVAKVFIDRSRAAQRMAELKKKEAEYSRMSQQVTEAKLQALQAQVEPHFLYNTLANVRALTEVDPARAGTMVDHLIQYLRNALPKMRESISTVGQEIELVRAYLSILQMRMGKRLSFDIAVPGHVAGLPFPPLMLPSLVENAIKHGLEPQREGGSVHISAQASDGRLRLTVADTGRGFGETVGNGVGLANIRERLAALYGHDARLTLEANTPAGVIATIDVPTEGLRNGAGAGAPPAGSEQPAEPRTTAGKVLSTVGAVERVWRKSLSFAFVGLTAFAAVVAGLAVAGIVTGLLPVHVGEEAVGGAGGALIGTAGVFLAFGVVVLVLAAVLALVYGLGFMFAGLAIFIPVMVVVAMSPALAPLVLLGLGLWWLIRRGKRKKAEAAAAAKVEPRMETPPPAPPAEPIIRRSADTPPPIPPEEPPRAG